MYKRLTAPFREFGFLAGLLYVVGKGLESISPHLRLYVYELMVQPIHDASLLPDRLGQGLEIRQIRRGDPEVDLMPARPEIKESRFEQQALCLGAFRKDRFIGYMWLCFGAYEEDEVRCTYLLSPHGQSVFDFDLYIFPEYRMGRAFAGIWNGASQYLHKRGIRFTFSRLTRYNLPSRRAHAHLGCKRVARTIFFQAWTLEFMVSSIRPYVYVSADRRARARLQLAPDVLLEDTGEDAA